MRLLLLLALTGCSEAVSVPRAKQDPQEALSRTPQPRTYRYAEGELRVFEVPVRVGRLVDLQTCIVWRDFEHHTAAMQCPAETSDLPVTGSAEADRP